MLIIVLCSLSVPFDKYFFVNFKLNFLSQLLLTKCWDALIDEMAVLLLSKEVLA